ncbi:MAG: hypothetical protein KUG79_11710 [Pseudomonadales bacterium]|nr:hypothetical protein [Pseudomonadales bacterium]
MCVLTVVYFNLVDHYRPIGRELLQNASFDAGLSGWSASANVSRNQLQRIDLSNGHVADGHSIFQVVPRPASGLVRLTATARTSDVAVGPKVWQVARIQVLGRVDGGPWEWDFDGALLKAVGTMIMQDESMIITIPEKYDALRIECGLIGGTGTFVVEQVSLLAVEKRQGVVYIGMVLICLWVLFGFVCLYACLERKMYSLLLILFNVAVLLLLIPEVQKRELLQYLACQLPVMSVFPIDHVVLFFIVTLVIQWLYLKPGSQSFLTSIITLLVFSLVSECLQYYTSHREPSGLDASANIFAILLASCLYFCLNWRKHSQANHLSG